MAKKLDEQFQEIADEAVRAAERIDCSLEAFRDGLTTIRDAIQERLDLVRDELREKAGGDEDLDEDDEDEK